MRGCFIAGSILVLCACAEGSEIDTSIGEGEGGSGYGDQGGAGGEDDSTSHSSTSSTTGSGSGGEGGDTTGAGGGVGGSGVGGGNPGCNFASPNTCQAAEPLPQVNGDDGGLAMAQGSTSKWFVIKIKEDNSDISEVDMSYTVSLTSPPGMDYHLVVHQGPQDGNPDCNAPPLNGEGSNPETVSDGWDDDQGIGGEDDSLYLNINVSHVSGSDCNAKWTVLVEGGT